MVHDWVLYLFLFIQVLSQDASETVHPFLGLGKISCMGLTPSRPLSLIHLRSEVIWLPFVPRASLSVPLCSCGPFCTGFCGNRWGSLAFFAALHHFLPSLLACTGILSPQPPFLLLILPAMTFAIFPFLSLFSLGLCYCTFIMLKTRMGWGDTIQCAFLLTLHSCLVLSLSV